MRIVCPVSTHSGESGWLVYQATGELIAMIQAQPGPPIKLSTIVGPHVMLSVMLNLTAPLWRRLVANVPGGEGLC